MTMRRMKSPFELVANEFVDLPKGENEATRD
jgi:hypothetical protein